MIQVTARDLVRSLASRTCPACGGIKNARQTFCYRDYKRLDPNTKSELYDRLGHGYEQAVEKAMRLLKASTWIMPPERQATGLEQLKLFNFKDNVVVALDEQSARAGWEAETGQRFEGQPFEIYLTGFLETRLDDETGSVSVRECLEAALREKTPLPFILCTLSEA